MLKIFLIVVLVLTVGCKINRRSNTRAGEEKKVVESTVVNQSSSDPSSPNIHRGQVEGLGAITQKSSGTNSPNIVVSGGGVVIINGKEVK